MDIIIQAGQTLVSILAAKSRLKLRKKMDTPRQMKIKENLQRGRERGKIKKFQTTERDCSIDKFVI